MNEAESLWNRLLDRLDDAGLLTLRFATETPAEIAKQVEQKTGDPRVHKFVWRYYYPKVFGNHAETMTTREAAALIESFRDFSKLDLTRPVNSASDLPICAYCGVNPIADGDKP
jgi:hypothetical protein